MQRNAGAKRWDVLDVLPIAERQGAEAECCFSRKTSKEPQTYFFVKSGSMQRNAGARRWAVLTVLPIGERQGAEAECCFSRKTSKEPQTYFFVK
ncbi:MAG: hypothetical protein K2F95_00410, partial [Alistipes sp.]|nr:hypothetical protein [Alistipes sp.]